jgi:hypothetical protein
MTTETDINSNGIESLLEDCKEFGISLPEKFILFVKRINSFQDEYIPKDRDPITSLNWILSKTPAHLLKYRGFGKKTLSDLVTSISKGGLKLGTQVSSRRECMEMIQSLRAKADSIEKQLNEGSRLINLN